MICLTPRLFEPCNLDKHGECAVKLATTSVPAHATDINRGGASCGSAVVTLDALGTPRSEEDARNQPERVAQGHATSRRVLAARSASASVHASEAGARTAAVQVPAETEGVMARRNECGENENDDDICRVCGCCLDRCDCDAPAYFDAAETGEESEDKWERRTM